EDRGKLATLLAWNRRIAFDHRIAIASDRLHREGQRRHVDEQRRLNKGLANHRLGLLPGRRRALEWKLGRGRGRLLRAGNRRCRQAEGVCVRWPRQRGTRRIERERRRW